MYRLHYALGRFDAVHAIPVMTACFSMAAILNGGVFFDEFGRFGTVQGLAFAAGVAASFAGVALIAPEEQRRPPKPGQRVSIVELNGGVPMNTHFVPTTGVRLGAQSRKHHGA